MPHTIDTRNGDGVCAVLGNALTLPSSSSTTSNQLPGSIRFNPSSGTLQYYVTEWADISNAGGAGGALTSITATGDVTGVNSGSTLPLTLASVGTAGTYSNLVIDAKGRVISASALSSGNITTALGYTPANIASPNFTGNPTATTQATSDSSSKLATTAFVYNLNAAKNRIRATNDLYLFVSNSGSDSNNGTSNLTPFATLNQAWYTLQTQYDLNGHGAYIVVADGTYAPAVFGGQVVGLTGINNVIIQGDTINPNNVIISSSGSYVDAISITDGAIVTLEGLTVVSSNYGNGITVRNATLSFNNINFGNCPNAAQLYGDVGSYVSCASSYSISGSSSSHITTSNGGQIRLFPGTTVTMIGSLNFSSFFIYVNGGVVLAASGVTFSGGTITGAKYNVILQGLLNSQGQGINYLPGNIAGQTSTGGLYV